MKISNAKGAFKIAYKAEDSVLMVGVHGIGKSEVVRSFAEENDFHMETLFLSHQEVGDLIGIPKTIEREGEVITSWSKPIWLQRLHTAVWPQVSEFSDIVFNDKDFEKFVKESLNID